MNKRRRGLERFLYRYDKDETLRKQFAENPDQVARDLNLGNKELEALKAGDFVSFYEWGVHPLLVRNYTGFLKVDYYGMLRERGYNPE